MKLYEIKDWDKIKVRNTRWSCEYITYNSEDDCFYDYEGYKYGIHITHLLDDNAWEVYQEPKKLNKEDVLEALDLNIDKLDVVLTELRMIRELLKEEL